MRCCVCYEVFFLVVLLVWSDVLLRVVVISVVVVLCLWCVMLFACVVVVCVCFAFK